jgi:DNA-binding CsgD family transcriptional regulator
LGRPKKALASTGAVQQNPPIDMSSPPRAPAPPAAPSTPSARSAAPARVAFVTVGQSPRDDVVPELLAHIGRPVDAVEFGALDGLGAEAIAALAPAPGEPSLSTRANGASVVVSKPQIIGRVNRILARIERLGFDLTVLLSTGYFDGLAPRGALIEAERVIQTAIDSVAMTGQTVGIVMPLARQIDEYAARRWADVRLRLSHAPCEDSPQLAAAARELRDCDLILLHSIAYTEGQRATVAALTGRPVVLARRVVAGTMRLMLSGALDGTNGAERRDAAQRMAFLTPREREILVLVVDGLPNKAIGRRLGISPRTVEIHRANLMEKMGARSLAMLVRRAIELERAGGGLPAPGRRAARTAALAAGAIT